eukprot:14360311-Ditylum_brightwellii.AAC.1
MALSHKDTSGEPNFNVNPTPTQQCPSIPVPLPLPETEHNRSVTKLTHDPHAYPAFALGNWAELFCKVDLILRTPYQTPSTPFLCFSFVMEAAAHNAAVLQT